MIWWTAEEDQRLTELVKSGKSSGAIAAEMEGRTRRSIAGRMNRLGLKSHNPVGFNGRSISVAENRNNTNVRGGLVNANRLHAGNIRGKKEGRKFDPHHVDRVAAPDQPLVKLADLKRGECRFPFGDPREDNFGFCGAPRLPGYPYCSTHCELAYSNFVCAEAV
jgi:GcrA cell cycle regulator